MAISLWINMKSIRGLFLPIERRCCSVSRQGKIKKLNKGNSFSYYISSTAVMCASVVLIHLVGIHFMLDLFILNGAAFTAGMIDAVVGGGGLIPLFYTF